jgi:Lysozyme inhibitor LprI
MMQNKIISCFSDCLKIVFLLLSLVLSSFNIHASDEILNELLQKSGTSMEELKIHLDDCSKSQLSMNTCSFYNRIEAESWLIQELMLKKDVLAENCYKSLEEKQSTWEINANNYCIEKAGGGSMRPMNYSSCMSGAITDRVMPISKLQTCEDIENLRTTVIPPNIKEGQWVVPNKVNEDFDTLEIEYNADDEFRFTIVTVSNTPTDNKLCTGRPYHLSFLGTVNKGIVKHIDNECELTLEISENSVDIHVTGCKDIFPCNAPHGGYKWKSSEITFWQNYF